MMKTKSEIMQIIEQELLSRIEIQFAYVFGSFTATGPFRDIDMGIYLAELSDSARQTYDTQLALTLERALNLQVDVVVMNRAPDHLIHQISKGKLLLDRDLNLRADFISAAWVRYFDFQPKRRMYLEALAGR